MKNIILLNGSSIKNADIPNHDDCLYFAINRKNLIEKDILKKNIDVWTVLSPPEMVDMVEDIYEFLSRARENRIITTSWALWHIRQYLEVRPLPNAHRVVLVDNLCLKMIQHYAPHAISLETGGGKWNTLAILFYYLALTDPKTSNFLFGCDGAPDNSIENIYFNQNELSAERLKMSNIYGDMKFFDENLPKFFNQESLNLNVFNCNKESFYKSIAFSDIPKEIEGFADVFRFKTHSFTAKELLQKAQSQKSIFPTLPTQINFDYSPIVVRLEEILKKLKKSNWFLRIFKKNKKNKSIN